MNNIYKENSLNFFYLLSSLLFIGLICSKFLISIAVIGFFLSFILSFNTTSFKLNFLSKPSFWMPNMILLLFVISMFFSENKTQALEITKVILPLGVFSLYFSTIRPLKKEAIQHLFFIFNCLILIAGIAVVLNLFLNFEQIQKMLNESKGIPTPNRDHIRFSILMNLAFFYSIYLYQMHYNPMNKIKRWIHLIYAGLFFIIIHLLSVRTGLMILYAGVFLASMILILKKRSLLIGLMAIFLMISAPYMAYKFMPGFNTKVHLTLHNIRLMQKGQVGPYSDTRRLLSYKIAWSIFKANPILGVGIGDLKEEMATAYQQNYPSQKVMYPHNMFLTILAGMGLPALLIFMIAFSWPLLRWKNSGSLLFLFFYLSIGLSFLTENTLFRSMGLCTYAYFLFLILKLNQGDQES